MSIYVNQDLARDRHATLMRQAKAERLARSVTASDREEAQSRHQLSWARRWILRPAYRGV